MSSKSDIKEEVSSSSSPSKGSVMKAVGSGVNSGVISMMRRPSSWPNLLSDYWFNATNSLESPLKVASLLPTHPQTTNQAPLREVIDMKREQSEDVGAYDDGINSEDDEEENNKCLVIIGRSDNYFMDEVMKSNVKQRFYDDHDEIHFLDEDTQSVLLSPQLFSHSSVLNPSLNGSREDSPNYADVNHQHVRGTKEPKPHFPIGDFDFLECEICLRKQWLYRRSCCSFPACCDCLKAYFTTKIEQSIVTIECINNGCSSFVHRDEISTRLDHNMKNIYHRLLLSSNSNGLSKTCPQCNHLKTLSSVDEFKKMRKASKKDPKAVCVTCEQCEYKWCFPCCSPWHEGIRCKQYVRGDLMLHTWAKQMNQGQFNAQKCPKCKIFIQRSSGCDHMHCSRCKTDFCYRCGDQLRRLKFFGDHYSKLSVFGCKYRYKASQPVQRKLVRAAVFGSKILLAPVVGSLALAAGAMILGVGVAALPLYGGIRFYRKYQSQKFHAHEPQTRDKSLLSSKDVGVQTTVTTVTYFGENGSRIDLNILERINREDDEDDIYEEDIFDGRLFSVSDDENGIFDSSSYEYNHGINLTGNAGSSHVRILDNDNSQETYHEPMSEEEGNYLQFYRNSNQTVSL